MKLGQQIDAALNERVRRGFGPFLTRYKAKLMRYAVSGAPYLSVAINQTRADLASKMLYDWLVSEEVRGAAIISAATTSDVRLVSVVVWLGAPAGTVAVVDQVEAGPSWTYTDLMEN